MLADDGFVLGEIHTEGLVSLPGLTLLTKNDMSACWACDAVARPSMVDVTAAKSSAPILVNLKTLLICASAFG
jgi:hypothetical protein